LERTNVPFDHFETCRAFKGRAAFPPWMARRIAQQIEEDVRHAGLKLTATRSYGCPRQTYIEAMMGYVIEPGKVALRARGTVLHGAAASAFDPECWYTEATDPVRMTLAGQFGGYEITMLMDALRRDMGEIVDLKFPMDFSVRYRDKPFATEKHIPQMNIARVLLGQQEWATEAGYNPDEVLLTVWDHGCGKNDGPKALCVPHATEEAVLGMPASGGDTTIEQVLATHVWMEEQHEKAVESGGDTPEVRERVAASLPLVGVTQFGGKKCTEYCDVEPICSQLVRKYGEPEVEWEG